MPGNRVNVRLVVKPKPAPFVDLTPPKPAVVSKSGIPNWFKAAGIMVGVSFVFWLTSAIGSTLTPAATSAPMLPSDAQNAEVSSQAPVETSAPTPLPSRPDRWPDDGILAYGKTVNGWLTASFDTITNVPTQFDVWQFTGSKGDVITAKVNVDLENSDQNKNLPAISLAEPPNYDYIVTARVPTFGSGPATVIIPRGYVGGPEPNTEGDFNYVAIVNFTLPKNGTFALVVFSMNTSEGMVTYNLTLEKK